VLAVCRRQLPDRHEAEDAFQATFLVLVRKSAALRQPDLLAPWLHSVARRTARRLRHRAARGKQMPEGLDLAEAPGLQPLDWLARQEARAILDEEVERLPGKDRRVVVLCYLQGQSYSEAARSLGWPAGTVAARLARARVKLRDRLVRRGLGSSESLHAALPFLAAPVSAVPSTLVAATVKAGVHFAVATSALTELVSPQVITLARGVLQTMRLSQCKTTLSLVLVVGLVGAGLSGLAVRPGSPAQAQAPAPAPMQVQQQDPQDHAQELERAQRELQALLAQVQAKQRQLARLRQGDALGQIEAALKKLQQANVGDPQRRAAVEEFAQTFRKLKADLAGHAPAEPGARGVRYLNLRRPGEEAAGNIISDGQVLQVDLENNHVLLSAGSDQGIQRGQLYRVCQGGKVMPDQTGWIRITQANPKWSVATILQEFSPRAPMRPNDVIQRHHDKEPEGLGGRPRGF
jgi:RNA polymerase sigma factor (sigma-70 family)